MSKTEITYSRDGKLYYVSHPIHRSTHWLSVEEHEMPVPSGRENETFRGGVTITKDDGREYWRDAYPFAFYNIKAGDTMPLDENTDLFKDYAATEHWPEPNTREFAERYRQEIENLKKSVAQAKRDLDSQVERAMALMEASRVR